MNADIVECAFYLYPNDEYQFSVVRHNYCPSDRIKLLLSRQEQTREEPRCKRLHKAWPAKQEQLINAVPSNSELLKTSVKRVKRD